LDEVYAPNPERADEGKRKAQDTLTIGTTKRMRAISSPEEKEAPAVVDA
jgi:hypothetical protein